MPRTKTFGQKLGLGVAALMLLTLIVATVAIVALRIVVAEKDRVIATNAAVLIEAERLTALNERTVSNVRAFALSPEAHYAEVIEETDSDFAASLAHIRQRVDGDDSERQLDEAQRAREAQRAMIGQIMALRRSNTSNEAVAAKMHELQPLRTALRIAVEGLVKLETKHMQEAILASTAKASYATWFMVGFTLVAFVIVVPLAWLFTRSLTGQIGAAIHHISSSSTELQAAANQQATASKEQASAAAEVTTTIKELLATTRQIAESAQRVARVSEQTANAALGADESVQRANEGITAIKRQVALVVSHMVDLGKKSQQIGSILELINELAEQTNILSINATIEAAGAGDAGRRFAVVAEEIRKLADRVGGSTKDIRTLVEEIRAAANTTVMATEDGAKVVEAGTRQFGEVTATFRQIAGLVDTTTAAAREIELSTKQQTSAVEQVNVAITDVAQATRETESSSQQTLTTSSQLTLLAKQLANVVHLPANA